MIENGEPPDAACAEMKQVCDYLYYGDEGVSFFTGVLVVGCYSSTDAETGEQVRLAAAVLNQRIDRPETLERMLGKLREVTADLERRLAAATRMS